MVQPVKVSLALINYFLALQRFQLSCWWTDMGPPAQHVKIIKKRLKPFMRNQSDTHLRMGVRREPARRPPPPLAQLHPRGGPATLLRSVPPLAPGRRGPALTAKTLWRRALAPAESALHSCTAASPSPARACWGGGPTHGRRISRFADFFPARPRRLEPCTYGLHPPDVPPHPRLPLQSSWRRPKGIDSRARRKFKGTTLMPNIGYGSNKKTKHMLPNGALFLHTHTHKWKF